MVYYRVPLWRANWQYTKAEFDITLKVIIILLKD